ncbi:PH domain-containing protein [Corynebacterium sp. zg912]|uniref:PH domain-containing protein n=1 Tax=Corynebacterium wankanglinii TaxID=2735136 RepID=A0A7H0KB28_9CORY|nr:MULTISPECIES: PH domain-containing protein [Corynebacterium]MBA1836820.1 PH domain-containing protein [Corynebacterium wankanglinii]MCR5929839.1 PH domain-containing protein [Corynebacterium sp. zg912]QNP94494.1 PH domain-containing protein [Corynebacterium wankanglinii]
MSRLHTTPGMEGYRQVHRLTPLLRVWTFALALATIALFNFTMPIYHWAQRENVGVSDIAWAAGGVVAALAVIFAVSQIWWRRSGFKIGEDEVEVRRGVLTNQVRAARFDRIQAVDVIESFAPRLFGLASVRIEAAGNSQSAIDITYLPHDEAEEVRAQLLRRIGGAQKQLPIDATFGPHLVPPVPIHRSLIGTALQMSTLFTIAWAVVPIWTDLSAAAIIPVVVGFLPRIWRTIDQSWRFTCTKEGEMFHLTYGLANRRRQAVPRSRIHAVQLRQPIFWRLFGWWTVSVLVAGYGSERNQATGTSKLLPVGTWEQAMAVADAIGPLTGSDLTDLSTADYCSPRNARWISPIDWKRQTVKVRDGAVAVTAGRLGRWYQMVETPHIQELAFEQGPLQRSLGLANVDLDLVPGPFSVSLRDVGEGQAREIVDKLRARKLPPMQVTDPLSDPADEAELAPRLVNGD